ncbi:MAG: DNA primase, partial [Zoogloeaceae bacterium]|nr:DNA primase [Zoogloeaceae bacterium]
MSSDALRAFKADLLARIDIVPLIERHVPLKKAGASYMACCPFHSEKTPSFSVSPAKQFYHCFGCGAHGNAIDFLVEYQGLSFIEALRALAAEVGMELPRLNRHENNPEAHRSTIVPLLEAMRNATEFYKAQLKHSPAAIDYLKKRGLTGETVMRFSLGYAPEAWEALRGAFANYAAPELVESGLVIDGEKGRRDRFHGRVIFPIFNQKNDVIAFGGRIIGPGEPKYLNSPETPLFEKGKELFGLPQARLALRRENCAIVVEGYMDVVMLHQHGIEHAVATLGTATTPAHVQKLLRQVDRIVFCFDGDNAGRKAAWRALENAMEQLVDGKTLAFAFLPEGEDPDSLVQQEGQAAFLQRMRQALPLSEYLFEHLLAEGDSNSAEGRAKLIAEARPLIERAGAPI